MSVNKCHFNDFNAPICGVVPGTCFRAIARVDLYEYDGLWSFPYTQEIGFDIQWSEKLARCVVEADEIVTVIAVYDRYNEFPLSHNPPFCQYQIVCLVLSNLGIHVALLCECCISFYSPELVIRPSVPSLNERKDSGDESLRHVTDGKATRVSLGDPELAIL